MAEITIPDPDGMLRHLLLDRSIATGRQVEDLALEALLRGLTRSPAERVAAADQIRRAARPSQEDSTDIIRRMRDGE